MSEQTLRTIEDHEHRLAEIDAEIERLNAEHAGRKFPEGTRALWNGLNAERDNVAAQLAELRARRKRLEDLAGNPNATERAAGAVGPVSAPVRGLPLPRHLTDADVRQLFDAARAGGSLRLEARDITGVTGTAVSPLLAGGSYTDMPRVASLFRAERTTSPVVRTYRTSTAATAGVVAEGATKPDAGLAITPVDVTMKKIATRTRMSRELTMDFPSFAGAIRGELTRAVVAKENAELTTELLAASLTPQATTGDTGIDATAEAIATLESLGITPDGIIMSPGRLSAIRQVKDGTTGRYVVDPQTAGPVGLHGLRIVVTPELADTTVLVGAFADAGVVYTREAMSVAVGLSGTDFEENMMTMIAEERLALAVTQPSRVVNINLT